ncbi:MAG: YdhK family protein [Paenisporosarcina sp.]
MKKKIQMGIYSLVAMFVLSACGADKEEVNHENMDMDSNTNSEESMDMNHAGSGEVPEGLKVEENPTFKVGSQVIIEADHMEGMNGAKATIVGAFNTTAYTVSYTPTTGGERVANHKWVIHEELKGTNDETLEPGTEITLDADHMEGMQGATAEIDSAEKTTVYMIDYMPTNDGEKVTNHKWVTESELSAK